MPEVTTAASKRITARFAEGSSVTVYADPADPLNVALVTGARKAWIWMGVFAFFLSLGFWSPWALGALIEKWINRRE
jgi:hypothetical protein